MFYDLLLEDLANFPGVEVRFLSTGFNAHMLSHVRSAVVLLHDYFIRASTIHSFVQRLLSWSTEQKVFVLDVAYSAM